MGHWGVKEGERKFFVNLSPSRLSTATCSGTDNKSHLAVRGIKSMRIDMVCIAID